MTDEYAALNEALARYANSSEDGAAQKIAQQAGRLSGWLTAAMAATTEATDDSGYVTATVTLRGRVESVYLRPEAIRDLRGTALDQACVQAITAARRRAATTLTQHLEELTGQRFDLEQARPEGYDEGSGT